MYDVRWTYLNLTSVRDQVNKSKTRKSMLLWYTGMNLMAILTR